MISRMHHLPGAVTVLVMMLAACSGSRDADQTARLFLDQYLVASDQRAAIKLTTGRARAEIQKEIDLLSGFEGREQALSELRAEADIIKLEELKRDNGDVALLYSVSLKRANVTLEPREIFLLVGMDSNEYKIKSFTFRSPSESRTSNTP
jgi:hypothetical protein